MFAHNIIFNVAYQDVKVIELEHADVQSPYMICTVQTSYEQQAKYASQTALRISCKFLMHGTLLSSLPSSTYGNAMSIGTFVKG
jgi:hypothetical protein